MKKSKDVPLSALNLKGHQRTSYFEHFALMGQDPSLPVALTQLFTFHVPAAEQTPIAIPAGCSRSLGSRLKSSVTGSSSLAAALHHPGTAPEPGKLQPGKAAEARGSTGWADHKPGPPRAALG